MERVRFSWRLWTVKISPTAKTLLWACQHSHKAAADLGTSGRAWAMLREKQRALGLRVSRGCRAVSLAPTGPTSFPAPPSALPWAAGQAPATGRSDICPRTQQGAAELFLPHAPTAQLGPAGPAHSQGWENR